MKQFDRANVKTLSVEVLNELQALCKKHGLVVTSKGGKFDAGIFDLKLQFNCVTTETGEVVPPYAQDWAKWAGMYGFEISDLGKPVLVNGKRFSLAGIKPSNRTLPIIVQNSNGKAFKLSVDRAREGLKAAVIYA